MSDHDEIKELFDQAMEGDGSAVAQILEMQQQGRALRYYPMGRDGADDLGAVAVSAIVKATGTTIKFGMQSRLIGFPRKHAIQLVKNIHELHSDKEMRECRLRAVVHDSDIYLVLPTLDNTWQFTPEESVHIAAEVRDALLELASMEGLEAIDKLLGELDEL